MDKEKKQIYIYDKDSEADTCRKKVTPKLYAAGWQDSQIMEQRTFTDGKIIVIGKTGKRQEGKRADYLLRYRQNFPIAVVEAKTKYINAAAGLQQAKEYAEILQLKFAYATNGTRIIEYDYTTGIEREIQEFPRPEELWHRLNETNPISKDILPIFFQPFYPNPDKPPRYYQIIAINRATQAILEGKKRALLCMATGTGKTTTAFQIIYKLWKNRWNLKGNHYRPKVLFLADRSVLVEDPHSKDFAIFKDARCLVPIDGLLKSREIYFSTYQSLAEDSSRIGQFRQLSRDFFDLVVIDECHRGSATDNSNWRQILDYFNSATHLGMTATPLRDDNRDSYAYFGNPVYTYSLKQGIEDGFLAPYVVHYITTSVDTQHGWRPQAGEKDFYGKDIPDGVYSTPDFERTLSLLPRTKAVAKHLTDFLKKKGRLDKTIVFCVDMEHADDMRRELNNLNTDLTQQNPNYIVRIVSEEGKIGKQHLSNFMDIDETFPVLVTTSKLLSTGIDVQTCKNIVLFRQVNSMTEFKQIVGRGTRVREDKGKLFFTLLDYAGSANRQFADDEWDGIPPFITEEEIDENGETTTSTTTESEDFPDPPDIDKERETFNPPPPPPENRKFYVRKGKVSIVAESVQILGHDGKMRTVQFIDFAKEQIRTLYTDNEAFKRAWTNDFQRKEIIKHLEGNGISLEQLAELTQLKNADIFDLLCHVAFGMKPLSRKQRAERAKKAAQLQQYSTAAQEVIDLILNKYVEFGFNELHPNIIKVYPITEKGNVLEIINLFGGTSGFKKALNDIQEGLYAA